MSNLIHCFEKANLGKAPFSYMYCVDTGKATTSCQYCGTGIRYKFYLKSADGTVFFVGSDCIYKSGDAGLINIAKTERKRIAKEQRDAKRHVENEARQAKWKLEKEERAKTWILEHPGIGEVLDWASTQSGIPKNLHDNFVQWGNLSEKQVTFLVSLFEKPQVKKVNCPSGKVTIEGTIVGFKSTQGYYGHSTKMIVESEDGYRVYGTYPDSLREADRGSKVRFNATVQPSDSDQYFGFFSRPTKAVIV